MANEAPFPVDPVLTGIAVAYKNSDLIADEVLPRVSVGKQVFKYWNYPIAESFAIPDSLVGRRGRPNEIVLSATETPASTEDFGLDSPIPMSDVENAPANHDPVGRAVAQLTDYILAGREKRAADLVFAATAYASSNKTQLSGTTQWSDFTNSDPVGIIQTGIDACVMRPNCMVVGKAVWSKLRLHPKVIRAIYGSNADGGLVSRQMFADAFELDNLFVGSGYYNTAKPGQTASLSPMWGKHALLFYRNLGADAQNGVTFGFTGQWLGRIAGSMPDEDIGMRGGQRVRVGESVKELIIAPLAAYFVQDAVA